MIRVAVVDYGAGNLVSIRQGLEAVGATVEVVQDGASLDAADAVIVPGVGAAAPAMERLHERGLVEPLLAFIREGRPYLGICLGSQLLYESSDEDGATTLGVLPGRTERLEDAPTLPHIGWNQVVQRRSHPIFEGIEDGADFYFVHSFAGRPQGPEAGDVIVGETVHGSRFVSAVARGAVVGVQFHPERSGTNGLRLLRNYVVFAAGVVARQGASLKPIETGA